MVSPTYSRMSSEENNTHMWIHTHREYKKASGAKCKLLNLGRLYGSSLYYAYNCSMCLKLYKVKKKKIAGEWRVCGIRDSILFIFVCLKFSATDTIHVPSLRYGLGGTNPWASREPGHHLQHWVMKCWQKSSAWICGALLHILSPLP